MRLNEIEAKTDTLFGQKQVNNVASMLKKGIMKNKSPKVVDDFGSYKLVPMQGLPDGYYLVFKKLKPETPIHPDYYNVVLVDTTQDQENPNIVCFLQVEHAKKFTQDSTMIEGLSVSLAGVTDPYIGKGIAPMLYGSLVNHGQIIFSDTKQTPAGRKLWSKLIVSGIGSPWALIYAEGSKLKIRDAIPITSETVDLALKDVYGSEFSGNNNQLVLIPKQDTNTLKHLQSYVK